MKGKTVVCVKLNKGEINPFDGAALESALCLGFDETTVLTMSPPSSIPVAESITRLGVKVIVLCDPAFAGSDTVATSYILSKAISRLNPDFIFCGRQSTDGDTGQVPPMIAERLGFSSVAGVMEFSESGVKTRAGKSFPFKKRTVYTFERIRNLRFPSIFSEKGEVTVLGRGDIGAETEKCGLIGSPTRVVRSYESEIGRRRCVFVKAEELKTEIGKALLKNAVKKEIPDPKEKLPIVYYVGNLKDTAEKLGEKAERIFAEGKTAEDISEEVIGKDVKVLLFEDTDEFKDLAPKVAVKTDAGICADCVAFGVSDGTLVMTRPAAGGNVTADIKCEGKRTFATVRTAKRGTSDIVFAVGKGAAAHMDEIKRYADSFGAEICCSRSVADAGLMPYSAQVGLTGKRVSPKVYVAFGISGAVQHTCAISGAGTVIAVNNDKNARIFDYADVGIIGDISDIDL